VSDLVTEYCEANPEAFVWYIHNKGSRFSVHDAKHKGTWTWRK
jgi:hypothetical protein